MLATPHQPHPTAAQEDQAGVERRLAASSVAPQAAVHVVAVAQEMAAALVALVALEAPVVQLVVWAVRFALAHSRRMRRPEASQDRWRRVVAAPDFALALSAARGDGANPL